MSNKEPQKPIRVLHVLGSMNLGGAESRIMELYRCIDRSKIQFDFLVHTKEEGHYNKEIRALGGEIYSLPRFRLVNIVEYRKAIQGFFREHKEFAAVQGHMTSTASIYLPIAKKEIPSVITIAHARSAGVDRGLKGYVTKFLRLSLRKKADYCFACSKEAGLAVFGREAQVIPNAIDVDRFRYREEVRCELREKLGLKDKFVIGHVGRFGFMKNHAFLIDVFDKLCKMRDNMALVLIGKGEEEANVRKKLEELGLQDKVLFVGNVFDVERYYQIFDYFVFPSVFEGLPGSVVEAQAAGLRCMISDTITREVVLTDLVECRSISEDASLWAEAILTNEVKAYDRPDVRAEIVEKGFDVNTQAAVMEAFYRTGRYPPDKE